VSPPCRRTHVFSSNCPSHLLQMRRE
jgi:hypothetical protein